MSSIHKYIDYLRKDEIRFELDVLGISTAQEETVDALRKALRQVFKLSRRGSIKCVPQMSPRLTKEIEACTPKVEELESMLSSGDLVKDRNLIVRISVRANYLIDRLARLGFDNSSLSDLRQRLIRILAKVEPEEGSSSSDEESVKVENPKCTPVKKKVEDIPKEESMNVPNSEKRGKDDILIIREKQINLNSFNLKFNGTTCVRIFLERLEELRQAREIPQSRMLSAFSDLLEDSALAWFRCNKNNFNSYQDLIQQLREDFDIPDLDYRLKNEIRQRTQAKHETIVSYISTMQGMFSRLTSPMSHADQLEILMHNIRPEYMKELALHDISSIDQLKQLGKRLELARVRAERFSEPNSEEYQLRKTKLSVKHSNQVSAVSTGINPEQKRSCMRCQSDGHYTRDCKQSREVVCFKCGKKGVRRPECPTCMKVDISKN